MPVGRADLEQIGSYVKDHLNDWLTELKYQRELMGTRFQAADKRFEDMQAYLDKRFGAVDKRFADMHTSMNTRFAAVDKRFEQMQANTDKRFEDLITNMNKRFAETRWLMGGVVVMLATMMSLYQFLG